MRLGIVGSKTFTDYDKLKHWIETLFIAVCIDTIVSGGAKGADTLARQYAQMNGIKLVEYKAQWKQHGKKAGMIRNYDIVKASDMILAFWDGQSKGTQNTLTLAKQQKVPTVLIYI